MSKLSYVGYSTITLHVSEIKIKLKRTATVVTIKPACPYNLSVGRVMRCKTCARDITSLHRLEIYCEDMFLKNQLRFSSI